ncbi:MAG: hypothetical protein DMD79_05350 [Candidatus Rokuibacteriota bacterium]|nr:MAG: hypothetical protein DMD79_05350 [Candidatus Rokubacteria bacterium]
MGLEIVVPRQGPCPLPPVLQALAAAGLPTSVAMVDNVLQGPGARPPAQWRDVRLRTPAGVIALRRTPSGVSVAVFGNADEGLQAGQRAVANAMRQASGLGPSPAG